MLLAVIAWFGFSFVALFAVLFAAARPTPKLNSRHNPHRSGNFDTDANAMPALTAAHASRA